MNKNIEVLIIQVGVRSYQTSKNIERKLRENGLLVKFSNRIRSLSSKLKDADAEGVPIVIIVGPREMEQHMVSLRIMKTRRQVPIKICDVLEMTRKLLGK